MDYSQGKIYQMIDETDGDIYIGSTIQTLNERFWDHHIEKSYNKNKSNFKISLIEEYPCKNKSELLQREQYWIDRIDCINKTRSYRTKKQKNDYFKKWIENNKESYNKNKKQAMKRAREYQKSMGGRVDDWNNNSLVKIDPEAFISE
jgi:predicted GIY-YIG superfamily endonuclease